MELVLAGLGVPEVFGPGIRLPSVDQNWGRFLV